MLLSKFDTSLIYLYGRTTILSSIILFGFENTLYYLFLCIIEEYIFAVPKLKNLELSISSCSSLEYNIFVVNFLLDTHMGQNLKSKSKVDAG